MKSMNAFSSVSQRAEEIRENKPGVPLNVEIAPWQLPRKSGPANWMDRAREALPFPTAMNHKFEPGAIFRSGKPSLPF
jgi:hypothetical protein